VNYGFGLYLFANLTNISLFAEALTDFKVFAAFFSYGEGRHVSMMLTGQMENDGTVYSSAVYYRDGQIRIDSTKYSLFNLPVNLFQNPVLILWNYLYRWFVIALQPLIGQYGAQGQ
jgi:hypothetical protein